MNKTKSLATSTLISVPRNRLYLAIAAQCLLAVTAHSAPSGGKVVGGTGSIDRSGSQTTILQETDRLAVNWNTFDVAADEVVRFVQPSEDSIALNSILDNDASHIFGRLEANGQIILMNPNGVFFGESATINVGSLVASGLAVDPADFMNGELVLDAVDGTDGTVVNQGIINAATGGSVVLVGTKVKNEGLISAKLGAVSLAAGKQAVLTFDRQGMLGVKVTKEILQSEIGIDAAVENDGFIDAAGGKVLLTSSVSQEVFSQAVNSGGLKSDTSVVVHDDGSFTLGGGADVLNTGTIAVSDQSRAGDVVLLGENVRHTGVIEADSAYGQAGKIELHAQDTLTLADAASVGATAANGGGDIKLLGDQIGVFDGASIRADGEGLPGQVLIGGDIQGANKAIPNAKSVYVGEHSTVSASGLQSADGGKVVVYADEVARIYGSMAAKGGPRGGDGGFVETSGKTTFDLHSVPDVSSIDGRAGEWLIDPYNLTISDAATRNVDTDIDPFSAVGSDAVLDVALITQALDSGTNVFITTESDGPEDGNITLDTPILYSGTASPSLTLSASNDIRLNADIDARSAGGGLAVTLRADMANNDQGVVTTDAIGIYTNGMNLIVSGFDIDLSDTQFSVSNNLDLAGLVSLDAVNEVSLGVVDFRGPAGDYTTGAAIDITAPGGVNLLGDIYTNTGRFYVNVSNPAAGIHFADDMVIDTRGYSGTASNNGAVQLTASGELTLPDIFTNQVKDAYAPIIADSLEQSVLVNGQLIAGSGISLFAREEDIRLNEGSIIDVLSGLGSIALDAGDVIYVGASSPQNEMDSAAIVLPERDAHGEQNYVDMLLKAGSGIVVDSNIYLANGDFIAFAGGGDKSGFASELILGSVGPGISANSISTEGNIYLRGQNYVGVRGVGKQSSSEFEPDRKAASLTIHSGDEVLLGPRGISISGNLEVLVADQVVAEAQALLVGETSNPIQVPAMVVDPDYGLAGELSLNFQLGAGAQTVSTNGGDINIQGDEAIQFISLFTLDTSSQFGHGNIEVQSGGDLWAPRIVYSNAASQVVTESPSIDLHADGDLIWFADADLSNASQPGQALQLNLSAGNDIYFGVLATDPHYQQSFISAWPESSFGYVIHDGDDSSPDAFNISASAGNRLVQRSQIFSGGGDIYYDATEFEFSDTALLNTHNLNENANAIAGSGNITLVSNASYSLPNMVSQADCDANSCGDVTLQMGESVAGIDVSFDRTRLNIGGDFNVTLGEGAIQIDEGGSVGSRSIAGRLNLFAAGSADISVGSSIDLGAVDVAGNMSLWSNPENAEDSYVIGNEAIAVGGDLSLATGRVGTAGFDGSVSLIHANNTVGGALTVTSGAADIVVEGDLNLGTTILHGSELADLSTFYASGSIYQADDSAFYGSIPNPLGETGSAMPVLFRAEGDVTLDQADNHFSSVLVEQAQDLYLASNNPLDLAGISANNFTLAVADNVLQSGDLLITGNTRIEAANNNFSIDLGRASNQLNNVSINANFNDIGGVRIDDSDGMIVQDVYTKGTLTLNVHEAGAAIVQQGDWVVDDSTGNGVVLNLTASRIEFGGGETSVELAGAAMNATGWQTLIVDGRVGGSATNSELDALLHVSGRGEPNANLVIGENAVFENVRPDSYITLGAGNDTAEIAASVPFNIDLGGGDDTVYQLTPEQNTTISGNTGNDAFFRYSGAPGVWQIDADGGVTVRARNAETNTDSDNVAVLQGFETIHGADAFADEFAFASTDELGVTVYGGGVEGDNPPLDRVTFADVEGALTVAYPGEQWLGIEQVWGNSEPDSTIMLDGSGTGESFWLIHSDNMVSMSSSESVDVIFGGFSILDGGEGHAELTGIIDQENSWAVSSTETIINGDITAVNFDVLRGGDFADHFTLADAGSTILLDGGLGENALTAFDRDNVFVVSGEYSGSLNGSVEFSAVQNLNSLTGDDEFSVLNEGVIGTINSGEGNDRVELVGAATLNTINTGAGTDIVIVSENSEIRGLIDGGSNEAGTDDPAGTDTLDLSALTTPYELNFMTGESSINVNATGFENTLYNTESGFTLFSGDGDFIWQFEDENRVTLSGEGLEQTFDNVTEVRGGLGANDFIFTDGARFTGQLQGDAAGENSLYGSVSMNNWQITGENSGSVTDVTTDQVIAFNGIAEIFAGEADDVVVVQADGSVDLIDGGPGNDTLTLISGGLVGVYDGGEGIDRILGPDANNVWELSAQSSGLLRDVTTFASVEEIYGGSLADSFVFNDAVSPSASGISLFGGDGEDTLSGPQGDNVWDLRTSTLNESVKFVEVEILRGQEATGSDTIVGADVDTNWVIDGDYSGSLNEGTIRFSAMDVLQGGAGQDSFLISDGVLVGHLRGGAGDDIIEVGNDVEFVENVSAQRAIISGESGNDMISVANNVVVGDILGGAGSDQIQLSPGLQVSGAVDGGTGEEDVLDLTAYDLPSSAVDLQEFLGFSFINFAEVLDSLPSNVVIGGNDTNYWFITGENSGVLRVVEAGQTSEVEFNGGETLQGGNGEDYFIFATDEASITTLIDGGGGENTFALTWDDAGDTLVQNLINSWLIDGANSGTLHNAANESGNIFTNIAKIVGGGNQDLFTVQGSDSLAVLDGGAGLDELVVDQGQNNVWELAAAGGTVNGTVNFADVEHLIGDANNDQFHLLTSTTDVVRADGLGGNDSLSLIFTEAASVDLAERTAGTLIYSDIETLLGGAEHALQGANVATDWNITGDHQGTVHYPTDDTESNLVNVNFDGFGELLGGASADRFILHEQALFDGVFVGGGGQDSIDLGALAADVNVGVSSNSVLPNDEALRVTLESIEEVLGNVQHRTVLYGASDQAYTWVVDGLRSGSLSRTGAEDDVLLQFNNISAIRGGDHDDLFQIAANDTLVSMDGGLAVAADFVDYSRVNTNLRINLTQALTGQDAELTGVEGIRGNNSGVGSLNDAELVAGDAGSIWTIGDLDGEGLADGINDGEVSDGVTTVRFIDFNILTGGAGDDVFEQAGGVVIGTLNGGGGNDRFNITVDGINRGTLVDGGTGQDSLLLDGATADVIARYEISNENGQFQYDEDTLQYLISHRNIENIQENTSATTLEIHGSPNADTFSLADGWFQINGDAQVNYTDKRDVIVRASANDFIEIRENLVVDGSLALFGGRVLTSDADNTSITTQTLILDNIGDVGSTADRIRTNIQDLYVRNALGDIALQEQESLNLAEFVSGGEFDLLLLNGDLTNSSQITGTDDFRVGAANGHVRLLGENQITGNTTFSVTGDLLWENAGSMEISGLTAQNIDLFGQRNIEAEGPVVVSGHTLLQSDGDVTMENPENDFNQLTVTDARNVSLVDQNTLQLLAANTRGHLWVDSMGMNVVGDVNADAIRFLLSGGIASIDGNLSTVGGSDIDIQADVILQNGNLTSGGAALLDGDSINQNGSIEAAGNVVTSAQNGDVVVSDGASIRGQQVTIEASGNLQVQDINAEAVSLSGGQLVVTGGSLHATDGDISVQSGSYQMSVTSVLSAERGSINITAQEEVNTESTVTGTTVVISGNEVALNGSVTATQGTVSVDGVDKVDVNQSVAGNAGVAISTQNGSVSQSGNISVADGTVNVSAGGGTGDVVMSPEAKIDVTHGNVNINAGRDVVIADVVSSEEVSVVAVGGIRDGNGDGANVSAGKLVSDSGTGLGVDDALETNVRDLEVVTSSGDVTIRNQGNVNVSKLQTGGGDISLENEGDIALSGGSVKAEDANAAGEVLLTAGKGSVTQVGSEEAAVDSDAVTVIAENGKIGGGSRDLLIASRDVTIFAQIQGGNIVTPNDPNSKIVFSGSYKFEDQLLAVEPLEEVDPAVFNNVRSYFYNDISLRLPADQLYEDEQEEEEFGYVE